MKLALTLIASVLSVDLAEAQVCSITAVSQVAFGTYDVFDLTPLSFAGSVTYECTDVDAADRVVIEIGGLTDGASRSMTSANGSLAYQLYLDPARTLVWGTGAAGSSTYGPVLPGNGASTAVPIYGRVPARQDAAVGSYQDTLVVTLLF
ncbi:MAG: spore coat protein U domain-containing protein [Deltaproteobacteria bacterium]|nr:spore coat protein U domain-containing protein [Deltaproteobacteria bacterium]